MPCHSVHDGNAYAHMFMIISTPSRMGILQTPRRAWAAAWSSSARPCCWARQERPLGAAHGPALQFRPHPSEHGARVLCACMSGSVSLAEPVCLSVSRDGMQLVLAG